MAAAAKDKTVDAAASARDSTAHALGVAGGKADAAKESTVDAAASARDSASEAMAAAGGKVSDAAEQAKASAGGGLSSLIQGAKEGFVGAYDAAASVLVGEWVCCVCVCRRCLPTTAVALANHCCGACQSLLWCRILPA
jgi:hypothetical protein